MAKRIYDIPSQSVDESLFTPKGQSAPSGNSVPSDTPPPAPGTSVPGAGSPQASPSFPEWAQTGAAPQRQFLRRRSRRFHHHPVRSRAATLLVFLRRLRHPRRRLLLRMLSRLLLLKQQRLPPMLPQRADVAPAGWRASQ
mgnify:CR=1 FL=1